MAQNPEFLIYGAKFLYLCLKKVEVYIVKIIAKLEFHGLNPISPYMECPNEDNISSLHLENVAPPSHLE